MSNGYTGLQVSLKDANGALLNITGATPSELEANYVQLRSCATFVRFFPEILSVPQLSAPEVQAALAAPVPAPVPAATPAAPARTMQNPDGPATAKQTALIQKKGGVIQPGLTKAAAGSYIDQLLGK